MRKMKKVLVGLLSMSLLAAAMVGCGGKDTTTTATTASGTEGTTAVADATEPESGEEKVVKVGVCIYKFDDNFMTLYRQELQSYLESAEMSKDGVKYEVTVVDGKNDQAEQTNQIQGFIADDVDVIIANLVQASAAPSVINLCKDADIPVVFINREPTVDDLNLWDKITYVGADARQSGTFQGEIINELPDKGDVNGDGTLGYVMVVGDPENVDAKYRTEFSVKAVEDSGMKVKKLVEQRGDWDQAKGQEIVAAALTQYGTDVEVVFCNNDAMALGAVQAIESAGRTVGKDIYIVGVDALDEAVGLIKEGKMTGTVLNDNIGQSHTAAEVAAALVKGETVEKNYTVDYVKVTKDTAQ